MVAKASLSVIPEHAPYTQVPATEAPAAPWNDAVLADLKAASFSETSRSPLDGDESMSQGKFRTRASTKTS